MEVGDRKVGEVYALVLEGVWLNCVGEALVVACRNVTRRARNVAVITREELVRTRGEDGGRTYSQSSPRALRTGALSAELASERKSTSWGMRSGLIMIVEEY